MKSKMIIVTLIIIGLLTAGGVSYGSGKLKREISSLPKGFTTLNSEDQKTLENKHIEISLSGSRTKIPTYRFVGDNNFPFAFDSITEKVEVLLGKHNSGASLTIQMKLGTENMPALGSIQIEKQKNDIKDTRKFIQETTDSYKENDTEQTKTSILSSGVRRDGSVYFKVKMLNAGFPLYIYFIAYRDYIITISYADMGKPKSIILRTLDTLYNSLKVLR